jgi:hypothetical protein
MAVVKTKMPDGLMCRPLFYAEKGIGATGLCATVINGNNTVIEHQEDD